MQLPEYISTPVSIAGIFNNGQYNNPPSIKNSSGYLKLLYADVNKK